MKIMYYARRSVISDTLLVVVTVHEQTSYERTVVVFLVCIEIIRYLNEGTIEYTGPISVNTYRPTPLNTAVIILREKRFFAIFCQVYSVFCNGTNNFKAFSTMRYV